MPGYKIFTLLFLAAGILFAGDYVVVVNTGNTLESVPRAHLKRIFTGRMKELKGVQLVPINQPVESAAGTAFVDDVVGMSPDEYKEYWVEQQVKGTGSAPMIQKSDAGVKAMVSQIPGAIGYISSGSLDETVKQLTVE